MLRDARIGAKGHFHAAGIGAMCRADHQRTDHTSLGRGHRRQIAFRRPP